MSGKLVSLFIVIVLVSTINAMISVSVISELLQEYSDGSPMSE